MHLLAQASIRKQFLNIQQSALGTVDGVFGSAIAEDGTGNGDFGVIDVKRVIGIVDGQAHLRAAQRRAGGGAGKNHVLHRRASQVLGSLLTHNPGQGIDDIRFARTIGSHDRRDARLKTQRGGGGKGLESAEGEFLEIHNLNVFR